jgi:aspartyl protease family protein
MSGAESLSRHFSRVCVFCLLLTWTNASAAASVTVVGLFPGKAVVVINGGPPRTLSAGQKQPEGVTLISTTSDSATFDIDGKRTTLDVGQHFAVSTGSAQGVTLAADSRGHFVTLGQINGKSVRFLVDTGATSVAIPASFAQSAGIDYLKGRRGMSMTANGPAVVYRVLLDSVSVGDVTLQQVEAMVMEGPGLGIALLGMSFLNRVDMKREGQSMTLVKRF